MDKAFSAKSKIDATQFFGKENQLECHGERYMWLSANLPIFAQ